MYSSIFVMNHISIRILRISFVQIHNILSLFLGTDSENKFFPVPHAVPSLSSMDSSRRVFARMKVVPMDAISANPLSERKHHKIMFEVLL